MNNIDVKFMIDGNYLYHVWDYIESTYDRHIDFKELVKFLKEYVRRDANTEQKVTVDSHYFTGTPNRTDRDRDVMYNALDHDHITKHATKLRKDGEFGLKEDAVDVALTVASISDYYKARDESRFTYFVLFAGDSDFVPLITEMKDTLHVKTILLYLDIRNGDRTTQTGQALLEEVDDRIDFRTILDERVDPLKKNILKKPERTVRPQPVFHLRENARNGQPAPHAGNPGQGASAGSGRRSSSSWEDVWDRLFRSMDACPHMQYGYVRADLLLDRINSTGNITHRRTPLDSSSLTQLLSEFSDRLEFEYEGDNRTIRSVRLSRDYYNSLGSGAGSL